MADNYLITGYWGAPHVTAENDRGIHAGIIGSYRYVLPVGKQFKAEYIGNNTIRMYDGKLMDNGTAAGIPAGEWVDLLIANAGQGMKRNDLIVFQYSKDTSSMVESGTFVVVQGEETSGTPTDPILARGELLLDDPIIDQMELWRVSVSGATISAPEQVFVLSKSLTDLAQHSTNRQNPHGVTIDQIGLVSQVYMVSSNAGADEALKTAYSAMPNNSIRNVIIQDNSGTTFFAGGNLHVTLYKVTNVYGSIKAVHYGYGAPTDWSRTIMNGEWGQWCAENPACNPNIEYRTSERFFAKPVYTKVVDCGWPGSSLDSFFVKGYYPEWPDLNVAITTKPHGVSNISHIIRVTGTIGGNTIPCFASDYSGVNQIEACANPTNVILRSTSAMASGNLQAYVQIWYTKSTD